MTFDEELQALRAALRSKGTAKVVWLHLENPYFNQEFIGRCINEYEVQVLCCLALGEKLTPLEQLAVSLLRDSAGLPVAEGGR